MKHLWNLVPILMVFALSPFAQAAPLACEFNKPLPKIDQLSSSGSELKTVLRIEQKKRLVPVWSRNGTAPPTCVLMEFDLPTYGYPDPANPAQMKWGFPGPTLVLQKPRKEGDLGQKLAIELQNALPPETDPHKCNPTCKCSVPPQQTDPQCCRSLDTFPDCFHGLNTTNLNFHGTHVSPQKPQDWVLRFCWRTMKMLPV